MDLTEAAQAFRILSEHLRNAADMGLRRELNKSLRDAASPVQDQIRRDLPDHMPRTYAETLGADLRLGVSTAGDGVRITASPRLKARKLRRVEAGLLTHPLFGDREHWYTQTDGMVPRFFAGPCEDSAPQMRDAVLQAMRTVADEITRKV